MRESCSGYHVSTGKGKRTFNLTGEGKARMSRRLISKFTTAGKKFRQVLSMHRRKKKEGGWKLGKVFFLKNENTFLNQIKRAFDHFHNLTLHNVIRGKQTWLNSKILNLDAKSRKQIHCRANFFFKLMKSTNPRDSMNIKNTNMKKLHHGIPQLN